MKISHLLTDHSCDFTWFTWFNWFNWFTCYSSYGPLFSCFSCYSCPFLDAGDSLNSLHTNKNSLFILLLLVFVQGQEIHAFMNSWTNCTRMQVPSIHGPIGLVRLEGICQELLKNFHPGFQWFKIWDLSYKLKSLMLYFSFFQLIIWVINILSLFHSLSLFFKYFSILDIFSIGIDIHFIISSFHHSFIHSFILD